MDESVRECVRACGGDGDDGGGGDGVGTSS